MILELELRALTPSVVGGFAEVVDEVVGELKAGQFEELFPTDAVSPFAKAFVLLGVLGVHFDDVFHGFGQLGQRGGSLGM